MENHLIVLSFLFTKSARNDAFTPFNTQTFDMNAFGGRWNETVKESVLHKSKQIKHLRRIANFKIKYPVPPYYRPKV